MVRSTAPDPCRPAALERTGAPPPGPGGRGGARRRPAPAARRGARSGPGRSLLALLGGAAACLLSLAPAAQAADACANAAFRGGAAARLPDCRAWEQVSPVEKNGTDVVTSSTIASVAGGDAVYFNAAGAFAGAESVLYDTAYVSARGGDWATRGTDPALTPTGLLVKATLGLSEDGTRAVVVTSRALAPGAIEGGSNLYVRDLTQPSAYRLVAAIAAQSLYQELTGFGGQGNYIAGNPDLSAIAFQSATPLVDGAPEGVRSLYLWHDGRLSLASRLPDGTTADLSYDGNSPSRAQHRLSDDGTRVWFLANGALYQHVEDEGTTLISRSHRPGDDPDAPVTASSVRASADGREIFFEAGPPLTEASVDTGGGVVTGALYRWSAADDGLVDLTAPHTPADRGNLAIQVTGISPDGRTAWFVSQVGLTPDAGEGGGARLYALDADAGRLHLVARLEDEAAPYAFRLSPNGRRAAFVSFSPVAGADNRDPACREPGSGLVGLCGNVFAWNVDAPSEPVACLSCGPAGMLRHGPAATFGRPSTFFDGRDSRAVLDDGRVFFDSADRLIPADTNAVGDVYEYDPEHGLSLLSSGVSGEAASFGDISESGRDVFFVTADRLVPQDADALADLYTARVGGGIGAQQVAPREPGASCSGEACRPAPTPAPPGAPAPGTELYVAPDPVPPRTVPAPRLRVGVPSARALRLAARRGRLVVPVRVSAAGTVRATLRGRFGGRAGRIAARASGSARTAGTVRLSLRLSKAARQHLRRTHRLRLRLTVAHAKGGRVHRRTLTFTSAGTATSTKGGSR